jgi:hypothetical protein
LDCSSYNIYSFLVHVITCTKWHHVDDIYDENCDTLTFLSCSWQDAS